MGRSRLVAAGIGVFLLLCSPALAAEDELTLTAKVNKKKLSVSEVLVLDVTLAGEGASAFSTPIMPDFKQAFILQSTSVSDAFMQVNNKVSRSKTFRYVLQPQSTGRFLIDPITVTHEGKTLRTNPIRITVVKGQVASSANATTLIPRSSQSSQSESKGSSVLLRPSVSKRTVYLGEGIDYTLKFYRNIELWSELRYELPKFEGFIVADQNVDGDHKLEAVGDRKYYTFTLSRKTLYPVKTGELTIAPAWVSFVINPFYGQQVLSAKPLTIQVLPLPLANRPEPFSGLVGSFSMSANLSKSSVEVNQPIELKIVVKGDGNLAGVTDIPFTTDPNFNIYKSRVDTGTVDPSEATKQKTFEYILIPKKEGTLKVPNFTLSYFSLSGREYRTLRSKLPDITVISTATIAEPKPRQKTAIEKHQEDLRYLKPISDDNPVEQPFHKNPLFWVIIALNVAGMLGAIGLRFYQEMKRKHADAFSRAQSKKLAIKKCRYLLSHIPEGGKGFSTLSQILIEYLEQRTCTTLQHLTREPLKETLSSEGIPEQEIELLMDLLVQCEQFAYTPMENSEATLKTLIENTIEALKSFERKQP